MFAPSIYRKGNSGRAAGLLLLLFFMVACAPLKAQTGLRWVRQLGGGFDFTRPLGPGPDADNCISRKGCSVATDDQNNIYVAGFYADSTDFGNGVWQIPPGNHKNVLFLAKYDSTGQLLFLKNFYGTGNAATPSGHRFENMFLQTDPDGNVYLIAWMQGGQADLDPGPGTFTGQYGRYYLIKLSPAGNFVKAIQVPGAFPGVSYAAVAAQHYKLIGRHYYVRDEYRIYRYSLNLDLELTIDVRSSSGLEYNEFNSCLITSYDVDGEGRIYCSVSTTGAIGCTMTNSKSFMLKYSASGTRIWNKPFPGGTLSLYKNRIRTGGYLPANYSLDADPGPDSFIVSGSPGHPGYMADFDTSGRFVLARNQSLFTSGKNYGRSGHFKAASIAGTLSPGDLNTTNDTLRYRYEDQSGAGSFLARGMNDFVVVRTDDYENLVSLLHFGGVGSEVVGDWTMDRSGNMIVLGTFSHADDCDYDPGPDIVRLRNPAMTADPVFFNYVSTSIFLLKLNMNP